MQYTIAKAASPIKSTISADDLAAINTLALSPLTEDQVFVFAVNGCNDQVDRDFERFPLDTLQKLAPLFVGRTVICDHAWAAKNQMARIFSADVKADNGVNSLVFRCYMLRNEASQSTIAAIEGGILKEVSIGCCVSRVRCSICGEDAATCNHIKGSTYNGELCVYELCDPVDAYELSFVAVPAQPGAGVRKTSHNQSWTPAEMMAAKIQLEIEKERIF